MPYNFGFGSNTLPNFLLGPLERISKEAEELRMARDMPYAPMPGYERQAPIPADMLQAHQLGRKPNKWKRDIGNAKFYAEQGARGFPETYSQYMDPYQAQVADRLREQGIRTLREGILPELDLRFIGAGHHGSSRHRGMSERVSRDMLNEIQEQQAKLLSSGWRESGRMHAADRANEMAAAQQLGNLGLHAQAGRLSDISLLENQARYLQAQDQMRRSLAHETYLNEEQKPWQKLERQAALMHGMPYQNMTQHRFAEAPLNAPYQQSQVGGISDVAGQLYKLSRMHNP
jgi:hypothetical protein